MFVEVDGFHIAFSDIGHGEPVVLLPGKFMTRQRWFEVGIAESLAERLVGRVAQGPVADPSTGEVLIEDGELKNAKKPKRKLIPRP